MIDGLGCAGRKIVTASGSSHEEATRFLREEVEDFFTTLNKEHSQTTKPPSYQKNTRPNRFDVYFRSGVLN